MTTKKGRPPATKLTCKEIIDIIECGNEHNVSKLCFGELLIKYQADIDEDTKPEEVGPLPDQKIKAEVEKFTDAQEMDIKDNELALMAIEDPEEYEKALARGDLTEK